MSCANIGKSARAGENSVATKSSSMVERMSGLLNTKRNPSVAARHDTRSRPAASAGAGTPRIISSAVITQP